MINEAEWESIRALILRMTSGRAEEIITGKVTKSDATNNNIFMREFGTQPIPVVAHDFEITYYDTQWNGTKNVTTKKTAKVKTLIPKKGDTVVVIREMGTHRLPRCIGKLIGKKWILSGED